MAFAEERKKKARVNRFQPARLRQSHAGGEQGKQTVKQQQVCSQWDRRVDRDGCRAADMLARHTAGFS